MIKFLQTEDWLATIMGLILMCAVILLPQYVPVFPSTLSNPNDFLSILYPFGIIFLLSIACMVLMKEDVLFFSIGFLLIFGLAILAQYISQQGMIKYIGLESVFFSVAIGLLIRNTLGLPEFLKVAVRSEFFIKAGLVLLGTSVLFSEIMGAGLLGLLQSLIVVVSVWTFTYRIARKYGVDKEIGSMLSSAVSICGVSAAIATCGAIKGDNKKLSIVVSLVLVVAIPMMYIMPYLAKLLDLPHEVAGAWLGGTIDTTGAVVASGKFIGEVAEKYSVIVKSSQNVLLGFAALAISIWWSYKGKNREIKPTAKTLWTRFPKFVLGFMFASLVFSFLIEPEQVKPMVKLAKGFREMLFSIAFVCIGLETDFRQIFKKENTTLIYVFLVGQGFNIILTLLVALLLFGLVGVVF